MKMIDDLNPRIVIKFHIIIYKKLNFYKFNQYFIQSSNQGHRSQLDTDLPTLRVLLATLYQTDVEYGDYLPVDSANALVSIQIEETEADFKRMGSSGEFNEKDFDEMSFHTDTSEQIRKMGETISFNSNRFAGIL